MSALLHHPTPVFRLHLVPDISERRLPISIYRRRRIWALVVAVLAVFTVWFGVQSFLTSTAGGDGDGDGGGDVMQTISAVKVDTSAEYYTVRPDDTLWSIAQAVNPKGDIRPVLARLHDRYGDAPLIPGQNILVS